MMRVLLLLLVGCATPPMAPVCIPHDFTVAAGEGVALLATVNAACDTTYGGPRIY